MTAKMKTRTFNYLTKNSTQVRTFGYGMPKDAQDMFGTYGGGTYYVLPSGDTYQRFRTPKEIFVYIGKTSADLNVFTPAK